MSLSETQTHTSPLRTPHLNFVTMFGMRKSEWLGYEKSDDMFGHFDAVHECDRQINRQNGRCINHTACSKHRTNTTYIASVTTIWIIMSNMHIFPNTDFPSMIPTLSAIIIIWRLDCGLPCPKECRKCQYSQKADTCVNKQSISYDANYTQNQNHARILTIHVGVTNVRHGFSIPPYGKDGGNTSKSYTPQTYVPNMLSAVDSIFSVYINNKEY